MNSEQFQALEGALDLESRELSSASIGADFRYATEFTLTDLREMISNGITQGEWIEFISEPHNALHLQELFSSSIRYEQFRVARKLQISPELIESYAIPAFHQILHEYDPSRPIETGRPELAGFIKQRFEFRIFDRLRAGLELTKEDLRVFRVLCREQFERSLAVGAEPEIDDSVVLAGATLALGQLKLYQNASLSGLNSVVERVARRVRMRSARSVFNEEVEVAACLDSRSSESYSLDPLNDPDSIHAMRMLVRFLPERDARIVIGTQVEGITLRRMGESLPEQISESRVKQLLDSRLEFLRRALKVEQILESKQLSLPLYRSDSLEMRILATALFNEGTSIDRLNQSMRRKFEFADVNRMLRVIEQRIGIGKTAAVPIERSAKYKTLKEQRDMKVAEWVKGLELRSPERLWQTVLPLIMTPQQAQLFLYFYRDAMRVIDIRKHYPNSRVQPTITQMVSTGEQSLARFIQRHQLILNDKSVLQQLPAAARRVTELVHLSNLALTEIPYACASRLSVDQTVDLYKCATRLLDARSQSGSKVARELLPPMFQSIARGVDTGESRVETSRKLGISPRLLGELSRRIDRFDQVFGGIQGLSYERIWKECFDKLPDRERILLHGLFLQEPPVRIGELGLNFPKERFESALIKLQRIAVNSIGVAPLVSAARPGRIQLPERLAEVHHLLFVLRLRPSDVPTHCSFIENQRLVQDAVNRSKEYLKWQRRLTSDKRQLAHDFMSRADLIEGKLLKLYFLEVQSQPAIQHNLWGRKLNSIEFARHKKRAMELSIQQPIEH